MSKKISFAIAAAIATLFLAGCESLGIEPYKVGQERWNFITKDNTDKWAP